MFIWVYRWYLIEIQDDVNAPSINLYSITLSNPVSYVKFKKTNDVTDYCKKHLLAAVTRIQVGAIKHHTFSHYYLEMKPVYVYLAANNTAQTHQRWYNIHKPAKVGLATPVAQLLQTLKQ